MYGFFSHVITYEFLPTNYGFFSYLVTYKFYHIQILFVCIIIYEFINMKLPTSYLYIIIYKFIYVIIYGYSYNSIEG